MLTVTHTNRYRSTNSGDGCILVNTLWLAQVTDWQNLHNRWPKVAHTHAVSMYCCLYLISV